MLAGKRHSGHLAGKSAFRRSDAAELGRRKSWSWTNGRANHSHYMSIYVDRGARPLPFAFPNSTSAESAFFVQVDYFPIIPPLGQRDAFEKRPVIPTCQRELVRSLVVRSTIPVSNVESDGSARRNDGG